ncbi:MAG: DUF2163 domain-containing protein [Alphaproteobacteria bacterium]|nr:MAG: DUF2163 domain-containing protein [Alphaproteobacteria bacterium]
MKTAGSPLATHIAGETTTLATCWNVTRRDGAIFGFTDFDKDLTVDSLLYQARSGYTRSAIHTIANLAVDNLDIESAIDSETLSAADLRAGVWDGAMVEIFLVNWANLANGKIILKRGTIGDVELKDTVFRAELRGLSQALSQQIVELYTPDCRADLGDTRCKVNLATLTVTGAITAVTDRRSFADNARGESVNHWNGGLLTWTSGANVGRKMEVKAFASGGAFTLFLPMPSEVAVGDNYSLRPGCDKKFSTCKDRYSNLRNFRGEPNVPGSDQVLAYPDGK